MSDLLCVHCGSNRTSYIERGANGFQGYYFECGTHGNSRGEKCKYATAMIAAGYAVAEKDIVAAIRTGRIVSNMQPRTGDNCAHGVISYHDCTECIAHGIEHGEHRRNT